MGGRGASSSKSIAYKKSSNRTSKKITSKNIQAEMDDISNKMLQYARYATPAYTGADKESKAQKYYDYQKKYRALQKEINAIKDKEAKNMMNKEKPVKRSKGRTEHEVTSSTYERALKRQNRDFNKYFGRGMEKFR